jgi:hypothetical protein
MIYIDSLKPCKPTKEWKWTSYCHLFADSLDELHDFAKKIGMKKIWFQNKKLPHYDLTAKRREVAISLGAQEVPLSWVKDRLRAK